MPRMAKEPKASFSPAAEIASYIKARILTRVYHVGQQLPTAEEFAKQFSVDPNTARAAFSRLADIGMIKSVRGKGTFVTADIAEGQAQQVRALVAEAISEGDKLGLSAEDLATILWVQQRFSANEPKLWYIDSWHPYFDAVAQQMEQAVDRSVDRLELARLEKTPSDGVGPSDGDIVATTKFSLPKVESALNGLDLTFVSVAPRLTEETLEGLQDIRKMERLGVICIEPIFAEISGKVIARGGIDTDQIRGNSSDIASLLPIFDQADAITISTVALERLSAAQIKLPEVPIVPFAYELDENSLNAITDSVAKASEAVTATVS